MYKSCYELHLFDSKGLGSDNEEPLDERTLVVSDQIVWAFFPCVDGMRKHKVARVSICRCRCHPLRNERKEFGSKRRVCHADPSSQELE